MLKVLRENLKYLSWVLWLVIAVFILFVFVDFGGSVPGGAVPTAPAVSIGSHDISYGDFERAYRQTEETYRQLYGEQFDSDTAKQLGLPMQVLNGLIADKILLIEAKRMGLRVTDDELRREILTFPAFQAADGSFVGAEEYDRILRRGGLTSDSFEKLMRSELLTQKVRSVLEQNVFVSDAEVEKTYRRRSEKASIRFLKLPWTAIDEELSFEDAEIGAFFEENRESFRIPERRVVDYLLINRREIQQTLSVEPERARRFYDENRAEFTREEQVKARHILVQVNDSRSEAEARSLLDEARRKLETGADFGALAAELSDDPGSRNRGGDLGFFSRGAMVAPFEEAAFGAEPGDIVGPITTDFGLHLIEVLEKRPGGVVDFADAEAGIKARLAAEQAEAETEARARSLAARLVADQAVGRETMTGIAVEEAGVSVVTTPAFGRDDMIPGVGRSTQFTVAAFDLSPGEFSQPVPVPEGWAILRLDSVEEPRLPELDEVRAEVEAQLRESRLKRLAVDRLAAAALEIANGGTLDQAAASLDLEIEESPHFGRDDPIGSLGRSPVVAEAALELAEGEVSGVLEIDDGAVLFEVVERHFFEPQEYEAEKESTRQTLESQRLNELLSVLIDRRRAEIDIRFDPQLLANFELDAQVAGG